MIAELVSNNSNGKISNPVSEPKFGAFGGLERPVAP